MWRRLAGVLFFAPALYAHVVSMSTGEIRMDGPTAVYELRIPVYEASHAANPETVLLDHIRFGDGHRTRSSCREEDGTYICRAEYEFPGLHANALEVECTLFQVTVPNHVHLLTAVQGPNTDQLVFDRAFTEGEARFHPPSRAEVIAKQSSSGAKKAFQNAAGLLFLIALALASRTRKEAFTLGVAFLSSEWLARPIGPRIPVSLSARFFEAALALTVAYLAIEILLLPEGRLRWLVVAVLGLFHGLSMAAFPAVYQAGGTAVQAVAMAPLAAGALNLRKQWRPVIAVAVMLAALAWFGFRLWKP
jgi:hypothetical protein